MPKEIYKYDFSKLSEARDAAQKAIAKHEAEAPAPNPPERPASYGRLIRRSVGREKLPPAPLPETSSQHALFCNACRALMLGTGHPVKVSKRTSGKVVDEVYRHLSRFGLRTNALLGCPLCGFILEELRQRMPDSEVGDDENNALGYDFGSFLGSGREGAAEAESLAVLFYEYTNGGNNMNQVVLTLHDLKGKTTITTSPSIATASTATATFAAKLWLAQCQENHSCAQDASMPEDTRFLPRRLVDVGAGGEEVRLVNAEDMQGGHTYLTLSHCWGTVAAHGDFVLTTARLDEYNKGISLDKLPRTFREACLVTRNLAQRYLWIDSLCIIQDSKQDWAEQSAQMWQIYRHSHLNISATASTGPTEGLFRDRPQKAPSPRPPILHVGKEHGQIPEGIYRPYSESEWRRNVDEGPVNSRAWVLQERFLAPRILHFAASEVYWECRCLKASEWCPLGMLPHVEFSESVSLGPTARDSDPDNVPFYGLLKAWSSVVERYSPLDLTFPSDKLVAVSALGQQVSSTFPGAGKYLAGLWETPLVAQLLWKSKAPRAARRAEQYRAPSWSWACIDGAVDPNFDFDGYQAYGDKAVSRPMLKVLSATSVANPAQPFGSVESGQLRVAGCLLKARLRELVSRPRVEKKTAAEHRQEWVDLMARTIPGYTGDGLDVVSNSVPENSNDTHLGIDVTNGVLIIDDSSDWWHGSSYGPRLSVGEKYDFAITLDVQDEMDDLAGSDLFVLPVSCVSANNRRYNCEGHEIQSLGCLILAPVPPGVGDNKGSRSVYRRVGMCEVENDDVPQFLCQFGNQEEGEIPSDVIFSEPLDLEHFVPGTWVYRDLGFIPKSYPRVELTIV